VHRWTTLRNDRAIRSVSMPFESIDDPVKLRRVLEATLLLETDLELPALLGHVVDAARSLTGARYGALGVLDDDRTALSAFITVGLSPAEEDRIGPRPTGKGVLGFVLDDPRTLRLARLGSHPDSSGFPPNHPPMDSFLGVPIKVRDEVYGSIYLTDKRGPPGFTDEDESLVEALAVAAGMAIENTRLHRRIQELAVNDDRDRTARDLHDTVIQHLYAVGLALETMAGEAASVGMAERLDDLVSNIGDAIRQVRSSIYDLGVSDGESGVRTSIVMLVRSLSGVVGFDVGVTFDGPVESVISESVTAHLLATIREAVTNVGRHAGATQATVAITVERDVCRLQVIDNGRGIETAGTTSGGLGLVNLRRRAEKLNGQFAVGPGVRGGTVLTWQVPVTA
jgi:signal transduction histidine kinase